MAPPAGLCFISTPQFRINKNTLLNQNYICPIGADVIQYLKKEREGLSLQREDLRNK
jgi:hypothetical protein